MKKVSGVLGAASDAVLADRIAENMAELFDDGELFM